MQGLRHAFAVEKPGPAAPTDVQRVVIDRLLREVVRRRMTTSALLALEMSRPLNVVASQTLLFFQPMVGAVLDASGYEQFALFLDRRGSVDHLARRLEELEDEGRNRPAAAPASVVNSRSAPASQDH